MCRLARSQGPPPNCAAAGLETASIAAPPRMAATHLFVTSLSFFLTRRGAPGLLCLGRQRVIVTHLAALDPQDVGDRRTVGAAHMAPHRHRPDGFVDGELWLGELD